MNGWNPKVEPTYLEVLVFVETPWHVRCPLVYSIVLVEIEVGALVETAGEDEKYERRCQGSAGRLSTYPLNPIKSDMVPTVKSAIKYIPRA